MVKNTEQITIQLTPEDRRELDWHILMNIAGGKPTPIYREALRRMYREEKNKPRTFYATGSNGAFLELSDGRYADTVAGTTSSKDMEPGEALEALLQETQDWDDSPVPLLSDISLVDVEAYVGQ